MSPELQPLGRTLILIGVILTGFGLIFLLTPKIPWLGHLPGDILIRREHTTIYIPLTTCLLGSLFLSFLMWLIGRFR